MNDGGSEFQDEITLQWLLKIWCTCLKTTTCGKSNNTITVISIQQVATQVERLICSKVPKCGLTLHSLGPLLRVMNSTFQSNLKHFLMCLNETSTKVEISSLSFNSLVFTIDFSENMPYSITPVVLSSLFLQFNSPENESASRVFDLKNGLVFKGSFKNVLLPKWIPLRSKTVKRRLLIFNSIRRTHLGELNMIYLGRMII